VLLPYLLNQLGSLCFYRLLSLHPLSWALVANALTQVATLCFAKALFGERGGRGQAGGCLLVVAGVLLCAAEDEGWLGQGEAAGEL
jgi:drug/metabolite transporter (DMT)-like permease